jgi:5-bromo-4-chloroindolyl phosphate hydrolysis protein
MDEFKLLLGFGLIVAGISLFGLVLSFQVTRQSINIYFSTGISVVAVIFLMSGLLIARKT